MDLALVTFPPVTEHTHTVVFLHGRGGTAKSLAASLHSSPTSQGLSLPAAFPSFRWVFPQAKYSYRAANPIEYISQWFDSWNLQDFSERAEVQVEGLRESVALIRRLLRDEAQLLGGRWDRIVLAGISQGAATSMHTLFNLRTDANMNGNRLGGVPRLGAVVGFSCRIPFPGGTLAEKRQLLNLEDVPEDNEVIRNTPVLLEHCADDPLIKVDLGRDLRDQLESYGSPITWKEYPDGGHWFNWPTGMDDVVQFLHRELRLGEELRT
ncbi:acyl-protein thioesterase [Sodiomyces alkalinus F11]|uniref:Acyl-protein thioesterase n=1 Tax=Sodiomyces alkalinus (strain CBS 110278 / VKM F-3762 / F11) TaxID=1314773 RepID=A0A3N2Q5I9_SODAK|nr:acyl-protein thioesterase [Sodiomyces alkalinus F11]ROT42040.1 acyl-protein thioesterase [Sodiomyces alkalinus F11]